MDAERWARLQALFHEATERPAAERAAFVAARATDDPALESDVLAMLAEDEQGDTLLDRDLAPVAEAVLDRDPIPPALREQSFGPYRIRSVLGEGGMGVVYLAERSDLGSLAALKILRDASLSPSRRERFAAEQRTLAQLHHPAIAPLYDADTLADGTPWFVMEYVEGVPITGYCERRATSLRGRLLLFRAVCEAVLHAHRLAVIHRDLKPSNILVKEDGTVKLLDFGIAKHLDSLDLPGDHTLTGLRLMTPAYAAPEQIRGDRVGTYTDVYALGVILYELFTGRLPFDLSGRSPGEAEAMLLGREPERPSAAVRSGAAEGGVPGARSLSRAAWADLDVLCLTAMHPDRDRRYRTVDALIQDIDHYLDGEPLDTRPDTLRYRLGKFVRRNRQPVAAGTLALIAVIALTAFYTVRLARARNAALAEATRTGRIQKFMLNLFQGGEDEAGPADSLRVVSLLDRGLQEARTLDREPAVQAELYHTLGGLYAQLGKLPRADSLLQASLDQQRRLNGPESPEVARALVALGQLRLDQARYEEAERLVEEGLGLARKILPANHPDIADATEVLGRVLEERGDYDSATVVLGLAVRLQAAAGKDSQALADAIYELANVDFYAGRLQEADSLTREVLAMTRALHGDRHPLIAEDLINLGAIQHEQGHYTEAERYDRQALELTEAWYGPNHPKTASNLIVLARALIFQNRFAEADSLLRRALAIQEAAYGPVHPKVASALNELGNTALMQDHADEAERYFTRLVAIYRKIYDGKHYLIGIALSNLASVYLARHEYPRAEGLFREALAMYAQTLPATHLNVGIARIKLGRVLLRQRRYDSAQVETQAGFDILSKQTDPAVSWLKAARKDLAEEAEGLGHVEQAAALRAAAADTARR